VCEHLTPKTCVTVRRRRAIFSTSWVLPVTREGGLRATFGSFGGFCCFEETQFRAAKSQSRAPPSYLIAACFFAPFLPAAGDAFAFVALVPTFVAADDGFFAGLWLESRTA
jgi:hypothetical protein